MGPDRVCASYVSKKNRGKISIFTKKVIEDGITDNWVFIEGNSEALIFLGKLLISQAKYKRDCSFFIGPKSAGNLFFNKKKSTHGLYIHRLPCSQETNNLDLSQEDT